MVNTAELNRQVTDFIPLISIFNEARSAILRFQSFTSAGYTFGGVNYPYVDAIVADTSGRQSYFAATEYKLQIRDSPTRSQLLTSLQTPGLQLSSLQFLLNNNGGRRSSVQIRYLNSVTQLPERIGVFQIVSATVKQRGIIILDLSSGVIRIPVTNFIRE